MQQKLSLLNGCPLASGNRPAAQKHRHQKLHERLRESIESDDWVSPEDFRPCFRKWCPGSRPLQTGNLVVKADELSDEEVEEELRERQALQEGLEKICTWRPSENLREASVYATSSNFDVGLDLWALDEDKRSSLLGLWLRNELSVSWPVVEDLLTEFDELQEKINEVERCHTAAVLEDADIVGCTISGASIRCELLANVSFPVVLVEEAAEILEPQLLAALPPSCQQLILIGDHFQLRPKIQSFRLAERHFDRSLIERLFAGERDYPKAMLKEQNRMRDEFLCLLKPFYPKLLTNQQRVSSNEPLACCRKSMYFMTMREHTEVEAAERRCPTNPAEAQMIMKLVMHMLREGCKASEISVLAMYDGQVSLLRRLLREEGLEIACSSVDRYQGDENNFVLISLVRSNKQSKAGFVSERNRLIVALSRARCGVYLFGNDLLLREKSREWTQAGMSARF